MLMRPFIKQAGEKIGGVPREKLFFKRAAPGAVNPRPYTE